MTNNFHVNAAGDIRPCEAQPGGCPLSTFEGHHSSESAAREAYEGFMEALTKPERSARFTFASGRERHAFTQGDCGHLAKHLEKQLALPLYYLGDAQEGSVAPSDRRWSHFVNRLPDGRFIDVEGVWTEAELLKRWQVDEVGRGWLPTALLPTASSELRSMGLAAPSFPEQKPQQFLKKLKARLPEALWLADADAKPSGTPLPNLESVYGESPRTNIGVSRVYGHLKGIQEDANSGRINDSEARSRIAAVVEQLKALEEYNDTATRPEALAYRERLEKLAAGAPAAKPLSEKEHWKRVQAALDSFESSAKYSAKQSFELNKVRDALRGTAFSHEGYSETKALRLSEALGSSLARAQKPEAKALAASIGAALAAEKKD